MPMPNFLSRLLGAAKAIPAAAEGMVARVAGRGVSSVATNEASTAIKGLIAESHFPPGYLMKDLGSNLGDVGKFLGFGTTEVRYQQSSLFGKAMKGLGLGTGAGSHRTVDIKNYMTAVARGAKPEEIELARAALLPTQGPSQYAKFGGGIRRTLLGAGVGGVIGAATTDETSGTGMARGFIRGAAIGTGIGLATTGTAFKAARAIHVGALARKGAKRIPDLAARVAGRSMSVAGWALDNPYKTLLAGGAIAGGVALTRSGAGGRGDLKAMGKIAQRSGISSTGYDPGYGGETQQQVHQMFVESTFGLTLGLHNGRHR